MAITSKLVGAGLDSNATTTGVINVADPTAVVGLSDGITSGTGDFNHGIKTNNSATTVGQFNNEVDEDGYSIQPPKEVAWDESKENGMSILY